MSKVAFTTTVAKVGADFRGRLLTMGEMEKALEFFNQQLEKKKVIYGEEAVPHLHRLGLQPNQIDMRDALYVDERNVSHMVNNVRMEGDELKVDIVMLDTPIGKVVAETMSVTGQKPVFSIRAVTIPDKPDVFVPVTVDLIGFKKKGLDRE